MLIAFIFGFIAGVMTRTILDLAFDNKPTAGVPDETPTGTQIPEDVEPSVPQAAMVDETTAFGGGVGGTVTEFLRDDTTKDVK